MAFLIANARWLGAGLALCFCSSLGQTFFVALFGAEIRAELGLSHGGWGGLYTAGTVASAAALMLTGGLADRLPARWLGAGVLGLLALACAAMAVVGGAAGLAAAIFALRFLGQGWCGHLAMTAVARWFAATRGRAVAVAALGFSLGEAALPGAALAVAALADWRAAWWGAAALAALAAPALAVALQVERRPQGAAEAAADDAPGMGGRHWTRAEALRHWLFWALTPGLLGPPFIGTMILFQQSHISAVKGWDPAVFAAALPLYAATTVASSFAAGWAVDRIGAKRLLPLYQAPLGLGCVVLALGSGAWAMPAGLALCGVTQGGATALMGSLWPELYGTRAIGAIRATAMAALVFSTALGPGVSGALIDAGVGVGAQLLAMAGWVALTCAGYAMLAARVRAAA